MAIVPNASLAAAMSENLVLGRRGNNNLLWHLKKDLQNLAELALGKIIICGKGTLTSMITNNSSALKTAKGVIFLSQNPSPFPDFYRLPIQKVGSFDEALLESCGDEVVIFGGPRVFTEALKYANTTIIYLTLVHTEIWGDIFFPKISKCEWKKIKSVPHDMDNQNDFDFTFQTFVRR